MFWKLSSLSASSPVESVLDKDSFTLQDLLHEEEIIQECRALNTRLIHFLRDRNQLHQLLRYIVEEAPPQADSERAFKFPFIACEIFTCEIDVIFKTLVDDQELMDLLFSFLEPNRSHSTLLAGYFSKVVICLMLRKTVPLMNYVQVHQDVFGRLVDLIGITSIMEVLIRLVGADDHIYPNYTDVMQWLADINLLEMIVDKLNPCNPPEVHANAAETLCAITRTAPSPLATRLSSPSFVSRLFDHALEDAHSKSALVHTLSVIISLLDPRRSIPTSQMYSFQCQQIYESSAPVNPDTVRAMLPKLGNLLILLSVSADAKILPTTFGELRPPLGKHRLKIVEFIAVLLKSGNDVVEEFISSGTIQRTLDLLFEYPYNNALHHNVESIIYSCLESKNDIIVSHLLDDCNLVGKILQADKHPTLSGDSNKPTLPASGKMAPKAGYLGHLTRISNKLVQLENSNRLILAHIQENNEWNDWRTSVLQERNIIENVHRWGCGRPIALQDRRRDSEEEDAYDRDYDVTALANSLSQAFKYNIYDNDDTEEGKGTLDRDDEDVYFDDESGEVVISSLRLGDDSGNLFTNSNWFTFQDGRTEDSMSTSPPPGGMDEINVNGTSNRGSSSDSDDDVLFGKDEELTESANSGSNPPSTNGDICSSEKIYSVLGDMDLWLGQAGTSGDEGSLRNNGPHNDDPFGDRHTPEWAAYRDASDLQTGGSSINPLLDQNNSSITLVNQMETAGTPPSDTSTVDILQNGPSTSDSSSNSVSCDSSSQAAPVPSLFEEDVEFVGVELEGTEKAMEQALKEGIVGEAGPLKRNLVPRMPEKENLEESGPGMKEFNDANFWRVDQEVAALE